MILTNLPALQVVLPLICAPLCVLIPQRHICWALSLVVSFISFIIALALYVYVIEIGPMSYAMGGWRPPFGIEYRVDALSAVILLLVTFVAFTGLIFARRSIAHEIAPDKQGLFYAMFLLCFAGLLGITITNDAFNIYVFLEISSLATYALIAIGNDRRALFASFEYLILGSIGATFILIAIGVLYMMTGTLNISDLALRIDSMTYSTPIKVALAFFLVGVFLKIAVFPLHFWLTNAYANAPSFVSVFLSATATKVSLYVLIRMLFSVFGSEKYLKALDVDLALMVVACLGILVGSIMAVMQHNIKRMLAYSSVSQIGYILLGVSLLTPLGLNAAVVQLVGHGLAKAALFMAAGCIMYRMGGVRLKDVSGITRHMPLTFGCFIIAGCSLIGIPGTVGFISKWMLLQALWQLSLWPVIVVLLVSSVFAVIYIWRVIEVAYFGPVPTNVESRGDGAVPVSMYGTMAALTVLCIVFGVYTVPLMEIAQTISEQLFNGFVDSSI